MSPISDKQGLKLKEDHLKALVPLLHKGGPEAVREVYAETAKRTTKQDLPLTGKLLRKEAKYMTPGDEIERRELERQKTAAEKHAEKPVLGVHVPRPGLTRKRTRSSVATSPSWPSTCKRPSTLGAAWPPAGRCWPPRCGSGRRRWRRCNESRIESPRKPHD